MKRIETLHRAEGTTVSGSLYLQTSAMKNRSACNINGININIDVDRRRSTETNRVLCKNIAEVLVHSKTAIFHATQHTLLHTTFTSTLHIKVKGVGKEQAAKNLNLTEVLS